MPSPSEDYVLAKVRCIKPGEFVGTVSILTDQASPESRTYPILLTCRVPPLEITFLDGIKTTKTGVSLTAASSFSWSLKSSWMPDPRIAFTISSPASVQIGLAEGTTALNEIITVPVRFACDDQPQSRIFEFTVQVLDLSRSFYWKVDCLDPPVGVIINPENIDVQLDMTHSLTHSLTLSLNSIRSQELALQVFASESFVSLSSNAVSIAPLANKSIGVTLSCKQPGLHMATISVSSSTATQTVPVLLLCSAPAFTVSIEREPRSAKVEVPNAATASLTWSIQSYWPNPQAIDYSLEAPSGVKITDSRGTVTPNTSPFTHSLTFECSKSGENQLIIRLIVGGDTHSLRWKVECDQQQTVSLLRLSFFQGPQVSVLEYRPHNSGWSFLQLSALDSGMIGNRDAIVEVDLFHSSSRSEPVLFSTLVPSTNLQPSIAMDTVDLGDTWRTKSTFFVGREHIHENQIWELDIPIFGGEDPRSRLRRSLSSLWTVQEPPTMHVQFIPIGMQNTDDDPDIALFTQETLDYLPFAQITSELADDRPMPDNVTTAEELAAYLITVWQENGSNPHELLHGLYSGKSISPDLCGIGEVGGNVAVSRTDAECIDTSTAAHEIGHNLSLKHAPCGVEPDGADKDFPYPDGSIGTEHGYFISQRKRVESDHDTYDLMSYCGPTFISRYYFSQAANNLFKRTQTDNNASQSASTTSTKHALSAPGDLVFSGTVTPEGNWTLHFVSQTKKAQQMDIPTQDTDHLFILKDTASGAMLASRSLSIKSLSHSDQKLWSVVMPNPSIEHITLHITNAQNSTVLERELRNTMIELTTTKKVIRFE